MKSDSQMLSLISKMLKDKSIEEDIKEDIENAAFDYLNGSKLQKSIANTLLRSYFRKYITSLNIVDEKVIDLENMSVDEIMQQEILKEEEIIEEKEVPYQEQEDEDEVDLEEDEIKDKLKEVKNDDYKNNRLRDFIKLDRVNPIKKEIEERQRIKLLFQHLDTLNP